MSERIEKAVVALRALPGLVALVSEFPSTLGDSVAFKDWFAPLDKFTVLLDRMIGPEMEAAAPSRAQTIWLLGSEGEPGWDLMATLLTLDTLEEHPEFLPLFVERLKAAIAAVLEEATVPE